MRRVVIGSAIVLVLLGAIAVVVLPAVVAEHVYSMAEVQDGVRVRPASWLGRTVLVRGTQVGVVSTTSCRPAPSATTQSPCHRSAVLLIGPFGSFSYISRRTAAFLSGVPSSTGGGLTHIRGSTWFPVPIMASGLRHGIRPVFSGAPGWTPVQQGVYGSLRRHNSWSASGRNMTKRVVTYARVTAFPPATSSTPWVAVSLPPTAAGTWTPGSVMSPLTGVYDLPWIGPLLSKMFPNAGSQIYHVRLNRTAGCGASAVTPGYCPIGALVL